MLGPPAGDGEDDHLISITATMTGSLPASPSLLLARSILKPSTRVGLQWQDHFSWAALSCLPCVHLPPPPSFLLSQVHTITSLFVLSLKYVCLHQLHPVPSHFQKTQSSLCFTCPSRMVHLFSPSSSLNPMSFPPYVRVVFTCTLLMQGCEAV